MHRFINAAGLALIKTFEHLCLHAYPDPASHGRPWTIGWGHTRAVHPGMVITEDMAVVLLRSDLYEEEAAVLAACHALNDNQFAALVSLVHNCGAGVLQNTHLGQALRHEAWDAVAACIDTYTHAQGHVMLGLVRRRAAEIQLFKTPVTA